MGKCGYCGAIDSWFTETPENTPYWDCDEECTGHTFCLECNVPL